MSVIKQYNTSQWETIVVGKQGPQGETGATGLAGATLQYIAPTTQWYTVGATYS